MVLSYLTAQRKHMKAKGLKIEVIENGTVIATLSTSQFMKEMNRRNKFLADLIKDFNSQSRGVTVRSVIDYA